ncbi:hypothetical protein TRFO_15625 [Tritrichomonas foetus]|uniref:Right handed beta helix domain-containing protein n=1 Tax=Tritrichomonas foetus TaxID=1144522 RepID=A0A1J4KS20_9EUKA|nr:hypothetical protein TRFO_15625 [Tritrichomonas foetus]|eukprot:OHT14089.1 hypothetical protein TRFO_15625 [Tritrichomonas foetus]
MMFLLLPAFTVSSVDIKHLSAFLRCSNLTISTKKTLLFKLDRHPIFLVNQFFSIPSLTLKSLKIKDSSVPLFYGNRIHLNLIDVDFYNIFNRTIKIENHIYVDDGAGVVESNLTLLHCRFYDCVYHDDFGGALGIINSSVICRDSIFEACISLYGGAVYAENSKLKFQNSNFTYNYANKAGSMALSSCSTELSNCVFYLCEAKLASTVSFYRDEGFFVEKCKFVNNIADEGVCVHINNAKGLIRQCEFFHNICESMSIGSGNSGVICCNNPQVNIVSCKFAENTKDVGYEPDIDIYVSGTGLTSVRFCQFDKKVEYAILKIPKQDLYLHITNCEHKIEMDFVSQKIMRDSSQYSDTFKNNFSNSQSLNFLIVAITGTVVMLIFVICFLSCLVGSLF